MKMRWGDFIFFSFIKEKIKKTFFFLKISKKILMSTTSELA